MLPIPEPELPGTPQRNSEPTPTSDLVVPADTPQRKDSGASSKDQYPSLTAAANGRPDAFTVTLRRGNGQTLSLAVYPEQTVDQLHQQISLAFGPGLPSYAIRLIFKSKVMSMYGSQTVGSFGLAEGDTLQLVVVRARRPPPTAVPRFCRAPHTHVRRAALKRVHGSWPAILDVLRLSVAS